MLWGFKQLRATRHVPPPTFQSMDYSYAVAGRGFDAFGPFSFFGGVAGRSFEACGNMLRRWCHTNIAAIGVPIAINAAAR